MSTFSCNTLAQVTLVGAGPGDPELLTLKALRAIQSATVLLVDDLVNPEIVSMASSHARIISVGKRGGCVSTSQSFIERLMIAAANEGETVVRLKGGDPFMFGRGGEEVQHLLDAGISVNVINGITSGLAASTNLGIPLTHREYAHGVLFITGHSASNTGKIEWRNLAETAAQNKLTIVIYMGIAENAYLQEELLKGLPEMTPVAVIQNATLPNQKHLITNLKTLNNSIQANDISSPAIIIVGETVNTASSISQIIYAENNLVNYQ